MAVLTGYTAHIRTIHGSEGLMKTLMDSLVTSFRRGRTFGTHLGCGRATRGTQPELSSEEATQLSNPA
jgi:hypothetical protein